MLLADDVMLASRIQVTAGHLGYELRQARTERDVERTLSERPALLLLSTQYAKLDWEGLLCSLRERDDAPPVLAFGPHMDLEQRQRALKAGVTKWVPNSKLATDLAGLIHEMTRSRES